MRAATWPKPAREAFEVDLVDLVEDRHHGQLNDFVFQYRAASFLLLLVAHRAIPGTCVSRCVSGVCVIERCSPESVPFPSQPPRRVPSLCLVGSLVLRHSPTSPERSCPPFGLWPSRTGLDRLTKTSRRSPVSRACCFSACAGSQATQDRAKHSRINVSAVLPSSTRNGVGV